MTDLGPLRTLRGALPNVNCAGMANADGSKQSMRSAVCRALLAIELGNGADEIRTLNPGDADIGPVGSDGDVDWQSALQRRHASNLPSRDNVFQDRLRRVLEERHLVDIAGDEPVRHIPARGTVVGPDVVVVHRLAASVGVRGHIARARPGVVDVRLQALAHPAAQNHADRVVVGNQIVLNDAA